jgi:hypothetical protein
LRTALVQFVMGLRRCKKTTLLWRLMGRYEFLKRNKGSGKSIIATARQLAMIIWHMLSKGEAFDAERMTDKTLPRKAVSMREGERETPRSSGDSGEVEQTVEHEPRKRTVAATAVKPDKKRKTSVAGKKVS